jgi:antirestriction protein ArdC
MTEKKLTQAELRQQITDQIVEAMEKGLPPWRQPWRSDPNSGFPSNYLSSLRYRGVNPLLLNLVAEHKGYKAKWWGTYRQWAKLDGQVRKGEHGTRIVFYKPVSIEDEDALAEEGPKFKRFFVLRSYVVFNVEQVDGEHLEPYRVNPKAALEDFFLAKLSYDHVEAAIDATNAKFDYGYEKVQYNREKDRIELPKKSRFNNLDAYYSTVFHELIHWTEKRLDWPGKYNKLEGNELYAMGELIAEIGCCYLETELGIPQCKDMTNHYRYLQDWLKVLRGDTRRIFKASAQAMKAVDYILSFSRTVQGYQESDE